MAELTIKVGDSATYEDGDVVDCFNRRRIRCTHAQHICHLDLMGFQLNGLRPNDCLAQMFREKTHQYRCERISQWEMKRVNLFDLSEEVFDDKPNGEGKSIDVPLFVERRLSHPRHAMFGSDGREVWYGGRKKFSHTEMDNVWSEIEKRTALREVDYGYWPASSAELKECAWCSVLDFGDLRAEELKGPQYDPANLDPEALPIKKRKHKVVWRVKMPLSPKDITDIEDKAKIIDKREAFVLDDSLIVDVKPDP